jgi:hypothetical protein
MLDCCINETKCVRREQTEKNGRQMLREVYKKRANREKWNTKKSVMVHSWSSGSKMEWCNNMPRISLAQCFC